MEAHAAGLGTLRELAEQFNVSLSWAFKLSASFSRTGNMARAPQRRHGRPSKIDRDLLERLVRQKPDIVLRELRQEFAERGVEVSTAMIAVVLRQMGLRLKKSRSMLPNVTPKRTSAAAKSTSRSSGGHRRKT